MRYAENISTAFAFRKLDQAKETYTRDGESSAIVIVYRITKRKGQGREKPIDSIRAYFDHGVYELLPARI